MEDNRILKEQVTMLQEALETGKQEWKIMKAEWKTMKESIVANKDVIISKETRVDTQVSQQTDLPKEREKRTIGKTVQQKSNLNMKTLTVT